MSNRIIVAFDGIDKEKALTIANLLRGLNSVWGFKVNDMLLDPNWGGEVIWELKKFGRVFVDLSPSHGLRMIGNLVKRLINAGADLISIASCGIETTERAIEVGGSERIVVALTASSINKFGIEQLHGRPLDITTIHLTRHALRAGVKCLAMDIRGLEILSRYSSELQGVQKIVWGIRPNWHPDPADHQEVIPPFKAIEKGADLLVIGEPIVKAGDSVEAVRKIVQEIAKAEASLGSKMRAKTDNQE